MGTFIIVVLESSACLALFYLLYKLALSKDTFHRFNRVVLLSMLLLSVAIPFGAMLLEDAFRPVVPVESISTTGLEVMGFVSGPMPEKPFPTIGLLVLLTYFAGFLFFAGRLFRNWSLLVRLLRKCTFERMEGRIRLYTHQQIIAPYSWMRSIVVSSKDLADNRDIILTHELAHIRLGHSWDLLFTDLCILVQWFNPAAWLLRQELQTVHEFEADDKVLRKGVDARKYQLLIIEKAVGTRLYSLANSLNHGSLKKRITMMLKEKSNPWARAKYVVVLPLAAISLVGFARPEFTNLQARSADAIDRVFRLDSPAAPSAEDKSSGNSAQPFLLAENNPELPKPLIVLDGKIIQPAVTAGLDFRSAGEDEYAKALSIDPAQIKSIDVLKGEAAAALYGEAGRNGVLVITTTKAKSEATEVENLQVEGKVVNTSDNAPVAGANIMEVSKDNRILAGTRTGVDGRFSLKVKHSDDLLAVSHISFESFKTSIQSTMAIKLTSKKIMLDETVVKAPKRVDEMPAATETKMNNSAMVEQMPQYPGGQMALKDYIVMNLKYPTIALDKGIQGKVVCSFIVDATGKVSDIKVIESVDPALDAEAVRMISNMPKWIPGKQNGVDCAVQYALPIVFKLELYTVTAKKK
jgi:TonB family protein